MHLVAVGDADRLLLLVQHRRELGDALSGDHRLVLERRRRLLRRALQRGIILCDLRRQLLDARMAGQERPRFESELRLGQTSLVPDPPDDLVVRHFGDIGGLAAAQQLTDHRGFGLRVGLDAAGLRQVAVDVGELLPADRHVVGAGEQAGRRAVALAFGIGIGELDAQIGDLSGKRFGRLLRHAALRRRLLLDVEVGDGVGRPRRQ